SKTVEETHEILKELERAWDEAKQFRRERDEARAQVGELTRELESHQAAWAQFRHAPAKPLTAGEVPVPVPVPEFASVGDAAKKPENDFPATMLFLPSALESATSSPISGPSASTPSSRP